MNPAHFGHPPIVRTERLILRGHRVDDHAASAAMWADPTVVEHISGTASTSQHSWMRLLNYAGHWSLMGFGYWVVEERTSGRFAGEVGFADFKRDVDPSLAGLSEIGWALARDMQGRGYATEAVRAAIAWAHGEWTQTFCLIKPANVASINVANKCGYREVRRLTYIRSETIVFARP